MKTSKRYFLNHPFSVLQFPLIFSVRKHTMQPFQGLHQVYKILKELDKKNIQGAIVETGCWKGGTGAYMAKVSGRKTYLFDSFEGFPDISDNDKKLKHYKKGKGYLKVNKEDVSEICEKLGVSNNVEIVEGYFSDTIPTKKNSIGPIAVLRLDGDLYSSTKEVLEMLYDQVVPGGYVVIDDYDDFDGCRLAIHEFLAERHLSSQLVNWPQEGKAFFRKPIEA